MIGLIGKKVGMTQLFDEKGDVTPITVIEAGPCLVTELRDPQKHGYTAVQLGFGDVRESRLSRPGLGQFRAKNLAPRRHLREFRVEDAGAYQVGQELKADLFEKGQSVDVSGVTKGRGFAGVVKRHGFTGGKETHGCTTHKQPGSIGASAYPSRVIKNKRLPGRMGGVNFTAKNLRVVDVDVEQNLVLVRGAVPGPVNGLVFVRKRS
jgi:large subunit ribosomal protein L3